MSFLADEKIILKFITQEILIPVYFFIFFFTILICDIYYGCLGGGGLISKPYELWFSECYARVSIRFCTSGLGQINREIRWTRLAFNAVHNLCKLS